MMRRTTLTTILISSLLILSGCGSDENNQKEADQQEEEQRESAASPESDVAADSAQEPVTFTLPYNILNLSMLSGSKEMRLAAGDTVGTKGLGYSGAKLAIAGFAVGTAVVVAEPVRAIAAAMGGTQATVQPGIVWTNSSSCIVGGKSTTCRVEIDLNLESSQADLVLFFVEGEQEATYLTMSLDLQSGDGSASFRDPASPDVVLGEMEWRFNDGEIFVGMKLTADLPSESNFINEGAELRYTRAPSGDETLFVDRNKVADPNDWIGSVLDVTLNNDGSGQMADENGEDFACWLSEAEKYADVACK